MRFLLLLTTALLSIPISAGLESPDQSEPRHLVTDTPPLHQSITDLRSSSKLITNWITTTSDALSKHFSYDSLQQQFYLKPSSPLTFEDLIHGREIKDTLSELHRSAVEAQNLADNIVKSSTAAIPNPGNLAKLKCYCDEWHLGYSYPPEDVITWAIAHGRDSMGNYYLATNSTALFLAHARNITSHLKEFDRLLNREGPVRRLAFTWKPTSLASSSSKILNKLRGQITNPLFETEDPAWLQHASRRIVQRSLNLTVLAEQQVSFQRGLASVDLACAMDKFDKHASVAHRAKRNWAKVYGCEEGFWR